MKPNLTSEYPGCLVTPIDIAKEFGIKPHESHAVDFNSHRRCQEIEEMDDQIKSIGTRKKDQSQLGLQAETFEMEEDDDNEDVDDNADDDQH